VTRTDTCHKHDGTPQGAFAVFVSNCRNLMPTISASRSADTLDEAVFHSIEYHNYTQDRTLPLFRCRLFDSTIRGQFLQMLWIDVQCSKVDLAHSAGTVDWQQVVLKRCNVDRFMVELHATDCSFEQSRFRESEFRDCVFERCTFSRCDFSGSRFHGASFIDCQFDDVDLSRVLWWDPKVVQIGGTWHGSPIPLPNGGRAG
jgi:uncharacterized protein YjbI with pentapeptide repeats